MSVPEKSLEEFYSDIAQPAGKTTGFRSVRAENRQDPVLELKRPLAFHEEHTFFYAGLLYGFCRLDASVTERFREATGSSVRTFLHQTERPLMEVKGFPAFATTRVAHLISSIENGPFQQLFFEYLSSQLIVDRKRGVCWRCRLEMVKIPDPFLLAAREPLVMVDVPAFVPYTHDMAYVPTHRADDIPLVSAMPEDHPALRKEAQETLDAQA